MEDYDPMPFAGMEFAENAEPRCPCVLLLDVSGSMGGAPIAQLNEGLQLFASELKSDSLAVKRVDLNVITFGGSVTVTNEFTSAADFVPPTLTANGLTPMGKAIEQGLSGLADRKRQYREAGIPYYRPWMIGMSDGAPTDSCEQATRMIAEAEERRELTFYAVGVENADMAKLAQISVRQPLRLKGLAFNSLFAWLSSSLRSVSRSNVGAPVNLINPAAPDGWAVID